MRIETLNRIKRFADQPTAEELAAIMSQLDSVIEEEYFWISVSNQNSDIVYILLRDYDPSYFSNKLKVIEDESNYTQLHFRIFRYLINVAKNTNKENELFEHLNSLTLVISDLIMKNFADYKQQQILFFVSEIILELPTKYIHESHIAFLSHFALSGSASYIGSDIVDMFIPKIIENGDGQLLYKVLDRLIFNVKPENFKDEPYRNGYDGYNAARLLNEETILSFIKLIGETKLLDFTLAKLVAIVKKNRYSFSHLNISTIEDSSQILDKNKYEFILIKFLRIQLELNKTSEKTITSLLHLKDGIFRRLAIHALNIHYDRLNEKFWTLITPEFLIDPEVKHEVFMLLKQNSNYITGDEIRNLIESLEEMKSIVINERLTSEEVIRFNTFLAKEYLMAFENCKTEIKIIVDEQLRKFEEIAPWKIEHPGYNVYFDNNIALDKNRGESSDSFGMADLPRYFDAAESGFKDFSKQDALKIINRINHLLRDNIPFILQSQDRLIKMGLENFSEMPNFFEKAWAEHMIINWGDVFIFFGKVIDENYHKNPEVYQQFISYCAWLIRNMTKDDKHAIDGDALEEAKNLCLKFLRLGIHNERLNKDPFFDILNSTDGKIYDATLEVLLRNARLNKGKNEGDKWYPDVKAFYSGLFASGKQTDATIWSLSMHLPQFGYLDMQWLKDHINHIFLMDNRELWILAMRGYHKYCNQVYKVIYDMLLNNNHYKLALDIFKDDQLGTDEVFEHIVMAYVANWKGSEIENSDSIIFKAIEGGNRSQIHGLIHFFLKNKNFSRDKMLELWKAILVSKAVENKLVYNDLLLLFTNLTVIDAASFELVKITLNNITSNQVVYRIVHSLFEMENADPIYRAKVLLEINEPNFELFYDRDGGFEKLAIQVVKLDPDFGKQFVSQMIERRLFNLLEIYNGI